MARTLTVEHESFALTRPFRIARGTRSVAEVVSVTIAEGDCTGRGECTPYPRYGESAASTMAQIESLRAWVEGGGTRDDLASQLDAGAARNAIDCALWDLEAKRAGTSVAALAGLRAPLGVVTALTVVIDTPEAMAAAAADLAGVPLIKVKVSNEDPIACVRAVRAAAPGPRIIVDPNESWSVAQLAGLLPELLALRIDLLEQPVPAADSAALRAIDRVVPICADEAVHVAADVPALIGCYDVVNVKLDKTGGLTGGIALAAAARAAGLGVMIGCMLGSSLAMAPALLLASDADFVDLDGPWPFAADRAGGIGFENGRITGPAPGFWGD